MFLARLNEDTQREDGDTRLARQEQVSSAPRAFYRRRVATLLLLMWKTWQWNHVKPAGFNGNSRPAKKKKKKGSAISISSPIFMRGISSWARRAP